MSAGGVPGFPNLPSCSDAGRGVARTRAELEEVIRFLRACLDRSCDVETTGLSPYHGDVIIGYALGGGLQVDGRVVDRDFYVPVRHALRSDSSPNHELPPEEVAALLRPLLEDEGLTWSFFNLKFDYKFLRKEGIDVRRGRFVDGGVVKVHDVFVQAHLLGGGLEASRDMDLKTLAARDLGAAGARDDETYLAAHVKDRMAESKPKLRGEWKSHMVLSESDICGTYAAGDTWKTRALHRLYMPRVEKATDGHSFLPAYAVEVEVLHGMALTEERGYPVNVPYLRGLLRKDCLDANGGVCSVALCKDCDGTGEAGFIPRKVRAAERILANLAEWYGPVAINPSSGPQLYPVLFNVLHLPVFDESKTEKGFPSLEDPVLETYERLLLEGADGFSDVARRTAAQEKLRDVPRELRHRALDLIHQLRIYKRASTLETYVTQYLEHEVNGVIHCDYQTLGARSARMSSTHPNQQNIPGGAAIRRAYEVRPGYILIVADESQIEYRLTAHYSNEPRLVNGYVNDANFDIHQEVTDILRELGVDLDRKSGKTLNFAILYGAGLLKISIQLGRPKDEVRVFYEGYKRGVPHVWKLKKACEDKIRTRATVKFDRTQRRMVVDSPGYVQDAFGRRYFLPAEASYVALNRLIQGCAAMLFKSALVRIYRDVEAWNEKYGAGAACVLAVIHDEVQTECRLDTPYWELKERIRVALEEWEGLFRVPIVASFSYTLTNWADAKYGGPPKKGKPTEREWHSDAAVRRAVKEASLAKEAPALGGA